MRASSAPEITALLLRDHMQINLPRAPTRKGAGKIASNEERCVFFPSAKRERESGSGNKRVFVFPVLRVFVFHLCARPTFGERIVYCGVAHLHAQHTR
jgi:hypothetical protein